MSTPPYGDGLPPGEHPPGDGTGNLTPPVDLTNVSANASSGRTLQLTTGMHLTPGS